MNVTIKLGGIDMRDFWDFDDDGQLDLWEESMKCATILNILDDEVDENTVHGKVSYGSSGDSFGMNIFKTFLLVLSIVAILGACVG